MSKKTLWNLKPREKASILSIDHTLPAAYMLRLADLGLALGEEVECLRRIFLGGPRVYKIGESVYSIAHDIASHVHVQTVCAQEEVPS